MNRLIRVSAEVMAGLWPIIVPLGILRAVGSLGLWRVLYGPALVGFVAVPAVVLAIVLYGRLAATQARGLPTGVGEILRRNGLCYLVAIVVIGAPVAIFRLFALQAGAGTLMTATVTWSIHVAVSMLTIYVLPIVFLQQAHLPAVAAGVQYFSSHMQKSRWILGIVLGANVLNGAEAIAVRNLPTGIGATIAIGISVLVVLLVAVAFLAATRILLGIPEEPAGTEV